MPLNEENQLAPLPTLESLDPESEEYKNAVKLFETEPPKTPRPPDLMPEGMATDTAPIYTQPDKKVGPLERIRLESENRTGVETTIPRALGRLVGSVLFGGDERKVEQKNALTDLAKGEWQASAAKTAFEESAAAAPVAGMTVIPAARRTKLDYRSATPYQIQRQIQAAGLDPDQIGRDFEGRLEWEKVNGETRDPRDVLADVVSAEAENTLRQRVHVSSRAAAALPEGGKNEKGFGYSFLGGGLMNLPYMGTYALSFATGMGPTLPLLASYDRRLQANREDQLGFTEEGDLGIVKPGMSPEEAESKAMVGAAAETAIEIAGGKVVGLAGKGLGMLGKWLAKETFPTATAAVSKAGQDVLRNSPALRKFVESWKAASEITQVQNYPGEVAEEWSQNMVDAIFQLDPKAPEGDTKWNRFVAANKEFKGQLGDILLTLAFIQGPQAITAGAKTVGYAQKEKAAERGAAEWLKVAGVSDEQAKEILANGDARAAVEYVTSDETRRQEIAKRVSDRSARIADDLLKTNEWMENGGGKNAVSRFVPPTPADLVPGEDGIARYESSGVGIEYDAPNSRIAVTDTRTGRQAFVFGGQTPAEGMEQAFAIADSFDREAQGRDAVNAKKRELLAKALEARGVDGTYILVDNPEQLMTQASEKARVALAQKAEEGAIPQAFVDTDENGNVKTFFILDNIRMGKGKDALGQSVNNIVEAATHEPVHVAQFSPKAAKTFNAIFDQADDDLKMDVIRYGISKELGSGAVEDEVKSLSPSAEDDTAAADRKMNALRRWFAEGTAYLTEGNLTDTTTGAQKLARRVRDFFKAGVAGVSDIRVLAERGLQQARGSVRIIDTRMQEAEQISTAAKPAGAVSGAASEQTGALPIAPGADGAGQAQEMNRPTGASQPETLIPSEEKKTVSVPVMITKKMERDLLGKGYEQSAIDKMTPSEAWEALQKPMEEEAMPEPPEGAEPPPVEEETTAPAAQATAEAVQPESPSNVVGQPEIVPTAVAPKEAVAPISAPQESQKGTEAAVPAASKPPKKETRPQAVARVKKALAAGEPVPAADIDRLGVKIPDTYGREGDNYVKTAPPAKSAEAGSVMQTSTDAAPSVPAQGAKTPAEGLGGGGTGTAEGVAERARPSVGEKVTFNSNVSALKNGQLLQPHTGKVIRVPELPEVDFVVYKTPDSLWAVAEYTTGQRPGPVYGETKEVSIQRLKDNVAKYGATKIRQAISEAPVLNVFSVKSVQKPTTQKEATDAEAVRGDAGQVREGKPRQGDAAEAGVRQGAEPGGERVQRQAPEASRGEQGAVKAPELMTPEEAYASFESWKNPSSSFSSAAQHASSIGRALTQKLPVNAKSLDKYTSVGILRVPPGYVREDDLYVFKPEPPTPPDDGGKKPVPPAREPEAQTLQSKTPSSDVSGREAPLSKIPKGARVSTAYGDSGVSYRGEFVKDNGDGTATLRAFGEKPKTGVFRRYGTDAKGVQIAKDVTVPLASVKSVEPPADLGKLTPAQRSAVRRAAKAQEAAMEAEIAAGETAGADVAGRMASAEERRERARTDNETMFRVTRDEQLQQTEGTENEQRNIADRFDLPAIALPDSIQREMQGSHREKLAEDLRGVHRQYQKDLADDGEEALAEKYSEKVQEELRRKEEGVVEDYVTRNGLFIPPSSFFDKHDAYKAIVGAARAGGMENTIYVSPEDPGTVVKMNNMTRYTSWLDFLNRLAVHNFLFPETTYELAGFTRVEPAISNAPIGWNSISLRPVLKQAFVDGERAARLADMKRAMGEKGFTETTEGSGTYTSDLYPGVVVSDLHDGNGIVAADGTVIVFDPAIQTTREFSTVNFRVAQPVTPAEDAEYMAAVEAGDMEKAQRMVDEAANSALKLMRERWENGNVSSFAYATRGDITLHEIRMPKEQRGQGVGTAKMRELLEFSQKHRMRVLLTPSTDFGASSKTRLEAFYRGLGFQKNSGRNKDYRTRETMIWRPAGYDNSADPVTRDDQGNVIPLSERFNTDTPDIRFRVDRSQTETPAFKAWFGDSKVVDKDGKPLVVYHGTRKGGYTEFKPNVRKTEQLGFGIHFAEDLKFAERYATDLDVARRGATPQVYETYLSIRNPLLADEIVSEGTPEFELAKKLAGSRFISMKDDKGVRQTYIQHALDATSPQRAERMLREAGYDGVRYTARMGLRSPYGMQNTGNSRSWLVFSPTQIKSATGNVGTFDPTNPDIRFRVDQTETPEFKRWFGDSKVVDADGRPMVVYHGTDADFTEFQNMGGKQVNIFGSTPVQRQGFFFGSSEEQARGFGKNVMPVFLSIKRPFDMTSEKDFQQQLDELESKGINPRWVMKSESWELFDEEDGKAVVGALQELGYDGAIFDEPDAGVGRGGKAYVAFRPEQIKSAIANVGTFDPSNPDIRFRVAQPQDPEDLARAQAQFAALRALMDKPPEDFFKAKGEPDTPIVAPVVLDRKGLEEIAKATGTPLQTPAHVSQKSEVRDALADYSEDFVRSAMDRINREGRPIETNDTVAKIREFERRRLQDAEVAAVEMDTAIRNGNVGRQLALLDEKEALVRDLDQAAQALSLVGSERGRQLAFLKYGLDRNLSVIYRLQRLRKASGAPVTLEQYEKMVAEIASDKAEMKKLAEEHERVVAEVEKETRAKSIKEVEERMNKEVLAAYRKGAEAERSNFEALMNRAGAKKTRMIDPAFGFAAFDAGSVAFRVGGEGAKPSPYPAALRDLARIVFTQTRDEGLGFSVFANRMFEQGARKGFTEEQIDDYVYDFARRLNAPVLAKPAEKWKPTAPKMEAGNPKKEGPAVKRRERAVKEAVRLAVAENMLADGGKIAEIAAKNLEGTEWEGITPLEVMEIVTGYPVQPDIDTRDELDRRVAMVRKHMLALQRLQELEQNKYPTKMTLPADKPDVTLRQLARELRDRMNDFQFPAGQEDERLLNAERALASRLRYAVEELQKAVDAGTPINEKAPRAVVETPEIADLRRTLKDLRAAYEALPAVEAIKEARDAERARRAANKRYHFWQKRAEDAKNGVFPETSKAGTTAERDAEAADYAKKAEAARREYWAIKKASPQERVRVMSEKVAKAEERLADLEAKLALPAAPDLRTPKKPEAVPASPEEAALAQTLAERRAAIERVKKAISARWREENADAISAVKEAERYQFLVAKAEMLEDRIRRGDFSKAPVRPRVWSARIAIEEAKVRAGLRAINERIEWEANAAAGLGGQIQNYRVKGREVYKFYKTMWDLSAVGVQSARLFGYDPIYGTKLIGQTAMNAMSDEDAARFQEAMHNDADYEKAFGADLALDQNYEDIFGTGMGESFMRDLERWGTGPGKGIGKRIVGGSARLGLASQRAFEMYSRMMRFHVFKSIINDPAHANLSKDELRTLANAINIMGGVGNTKFYYRDIASVMSRLMWSSRLFTAQWQTLTGGGGLLWNAGMARETSRAKLGRKWYQTAAPGALKLYSRSLAGTVALSWVFGSIGMLLGDRQPWEDEETMFWKAFDFLFGRRVIGSKSIDTFGGLTSYTALVKRAFKGSHVTMSGKTQPDDDWKAWAQTFANFARGRLRPDISLALSAVFGEDVTGQPFGPRGGAEGMKNLAIEAAFPITPGDMQETVADMWDTHGVAGVTLGLVPALASDLFGFSKGSAPRDPRYEINRHKAHLGQVRKALKEYREAPDQKKLEAYQALAVKYSFDRGVEESIAALDRAGNAADKIAKDTKRPEAQRTEAVKAAKLYWEKARDILRASR